MKTVFFQNRGGTHHGVQEASISTARTILPSTARLEQPLTRTLPITPTVIEIHMDRTSQVLTLELSPPGIPDTSLL
jgi:hypothetical protein